MSNWRKSRAAVGAAMVAMLLTLAGCGLGSTAADDSATSTAGTSRAGGEVSPANATVHPDTSTLCGDKPIKIAFLQGWPTTWAQITYAEMQDEASACPNVTTMYLNANGDQQKALANLKSVVAQGVDGVVIDTAWPDVELPGITEAFQQGVAIVPFNVVIGGKVGENYTARVDQALDLIGQGHADWIAQQLGGKGNVAYLGGPAGDPWATGVWNGFAEEIKKYPGINVLTGAAVPTAWSSDSTQQVMAGLFAQFPQIDGLVVDYGATLPGALRAYAAAGKDLPPIATDSSSNEMACQWLDLAKPDTQLRSVEGTTWGIRIAFRKALAQISGVPDDESTTYSLFPYIDTTKGMNPVCRTDLPPGADLSSGLSPEKLKDVLG